MAQNATFNIIFPWVGGVGQFHTNIYMFSNPTAFGKTQTTLFRPGARGDGMGLANSVGVLISFALAAVLVLVFLLTLGLALGLPLVLALVSTLVLPERALTSLFYSSL